MSCVKNNSSVMPMVLVTSMHRMYYVFFCFYFLNLGFVYYFLGFFDFLFFIGFLLVFYFMFVVVANHY